MRDFVAVVDHGGANLASVAHAVNRAGRAVRITTDADEIASARHVIIPGVGAAGTAMERLRAAELVPILQGLEQPVLGICLGMQLLFQASEEGDADGLGVLPGKVRRLEGAPALPVPHMGWNRVCRRSAITLLDGIPDRSHFYYVHSFAAPDGFYVQATSDYGGDFPAIVRVKNFYGVQFHPEKSAAAGAQLMRNFLKL